MRSCLLVCLILSCAAIGAGAAEEILLLKDGRRLIGEYDPEAGTIEVLVGRTRGTVHVRAEDILSRSLVREPGAAESPESRQLRVQREQDAADAARKQAEHAARLADLEQQRLAAERRQRQEQDTQERLRSWREQGFDFPAGTMDAAAIDEMGERHRAAKAWKQQGFTFDPLIMTQGDMQRAVDEARAQVARREEMEERRAGLALAAEREQAAADARRAEWERRHLEIRAKAEEQNRLQAAIRKDHADRFAAEAERKRYRGLAVRTLLYGIGAILFVVPSLIAVRRRHRNRTGILGLNLGLILLPAFAVSFPQELGTVLAVGAITFSGIGWLGALLWSISRTERDERVDGRSAPAGDVAGLEPPRGAASPAAAEPASID